MGRAMMPQAAPIARRRLPRAKLALTELGLGTAPLGGMYSAVAHADAVETLRVGWRAGIRYFDTAPMYGLGRAEHLLGDMLRQATGPRDWVLSSKVGRLMRGRGLGTVPAGEAGGDKESGGNAFDAGWSSALPFRERFDYSYDGVLRSYEDSQQRLGLTGIDLLLVHDIGRVTHGARHETHWAALTQGGGFRALDELRAAGCIGGFGLGVNEAEAVDDALDAADLDCCLLAGRYTLLDQSGAGLLARCAARNVGVIIGGVFNSGVLVAEDPALARFNYGEAPEGVRRRVAALRAVCDGFDVALPAAALRFALAHPAVVSVVIGARAAREVEQAVAWCAAPPSGEFWAELARRGLIAADAPT